MRTTRTLLIAAVILTVATAAQAGLSVFGGITQPRNNWDDFAKPGPHVGLELSVPVIPALLSIGADVMVSRNVFEIDEVLQNPDNLTATWYTAEAMGIAKVHLPLTGLYGKAGFGFTKFNFDSDDDAWNDYFSQRRMVGAVGVGFDLTIIDVCAMYHVVKWDEDAPLPETLDELQDVNDDYSFITVSGMLSF